MARRRPWARRNDGTQGLRALPAPARRPSCRVPVLALAALALVADAAGAQPASKDDARQKLQAVEETLRLKRAAEQGLAADVSQIETERQRLNAGLVETARRIQDGEGLLTAIEGRLGELEAQEKLLRGSLAERHGSIARLLGAMQRMGRDPPPVMITRREDALVMVRSAMMLATSFPHLRDQALALAARLEELGRIMGESRAEGEKLKAETQRLNEARVQLSALMETKRQSLSERQEALTRVRREAEEVARSVTDLNELIDRLDKVVARQVGPSVTPEPEAAPGGQGLPSAAGVPLSEPEPGRPAIAALPPAEPQPPSAVVLAPRGRLALPNPGRLKPAIPFAEAKGRLPLPVQGKRIIAFGDKAQTNRSSGIVLETRPGAQVVSPLDGWIVFAGVFRSYGQILIINGGDGYHMLLAGLAQIDVQLGQFVLAGEPVGLMSGAAQAQKTKATGNASVLYVELRKDGRSIDPEPWWANESSKKVQG